MPLISNYLLGVLDRGSCVCVGVCERVHVLSGDASLIYWFVQSQPSIITFRSWFAENLMLKKKRKNNYFVNPDDYVVKAGTRYKKQASMCV